MNTIKKSASYIAFAFIGAVIALTLYSHFNSNGNKSVVLQQEPIQLSSYSQPAAPPQAQLPDLTQAAEKSVSAVVHITTKTKSNYYDSGNQIFEYFFGPGGNNRQEPQYSMSAGSGVIISEDGY